MLRFNLLLKCKYFIIYASEVGEAEESPNTWLASGVDDKSPITIPAAVVPASTPKLSKSKSDI